MNKENKSAPRLPPNTPTAELAREASALLFLFLDMEVTGKERLEHIDPHHPVILALFPHTSHLDATAVRTALPPKYRGKVIAAAAADYWHDKNNLIGTVKSAISSLVVRSFPFARKDMSRKSIRDAVQILNDGFYLVIAPQGTRDPDAALLPGVAEIALQSEATIVPVFLSGLAEVLPKGKTFPDFIHNNKPRKVGVSFGEPIAVCQKNLPENKKAARALIMAQLKNAYEELKKLSQTGKAPTEKLPPAATIFQT